MQTIERRDRRYINVRDRAYVRGVRGLRVADASIMPTMVSSNTNAPSFMIGERCAEFLLKDAVDNATLETMGLQ